MSIKSELKKIETRLRAWWNKFVERHIVAPAPYDTADVSVVTNPATGHSPAAGDLPNPSLASCWEGSNAQTRHMNELSGKFSDEQVAARLDWAKGRGCNTVHWFLTNQGDGEGAGYSFYGTEPKLGSIDEAAVTRMAKRCEMALARGLAVVFWLMADDSSKWNKKMLANPGQFAADLKKTGLLKYASCVVLGLEMNEYMGSSQANALAAAVRGVWSGTVGTHHTSGKSTFAGLGDIVFWQVDPGKSASQIKSAVTSAKKSTGKPVVMFELARNPNRDLSKAALEAGAAGVGNW